MSFLFERIFTLSDCIQNKTTKTTIIATTITAAKHMYSYSRLVYQTVELNFKHYDL